MRKLWIRVKNEAVRFWKDTEGQDLVEYALIVAAIALGMIAVVQNVADALDAIYQDILVRLGQITPQ
jgi:Flp pilus assembly pilin Flp